MRRPGRLASLRQADHWNASCWEAAHLMSPPTDSHGPTDAITSTFLGPHFSKASYSGELTPIGLSPAMSGRCGTKRSVTARPTHFWPLASGRAPSMNASGQPITHSPSISDWVDSVASLSSISSETSPPLAGPSAIERLCCASGAIRRAAGARSEREARRASITNEREIENLVGAGRTRQSRAHLAEGGSPPSASKCEKKRRSRAKQRERLTINQRAASKSCCTHSETSITGHEPREDD